MQYRSVILASAALLVAACGQAQDSEPTSDTPDVSAETENASKKLIQTEADMPRTEFKLEVLPSEMVLGEDPSAFEKLLTELAADNEMLRTEYEIPDDATRRGVLSTQRAILAARGDWEGVLATSEPLRQATTKAADRALVGLTSDAFARAALATGTTEGEEFAAAFRAEVEKSLAAVDVDLARDELEAMRGQMQLMNTNLLTSALKAQIDPAVQQAGMVIDRGTATSIVGLKQTFLFIPHMPMIADAIGARLAEVPEGEVVDLWAPRQVDVTEGAGVVVAVWDTGVDSTVQGERMWVNPSSDGPGYAHGIAFGPDFERETTDLITEGADYADQMDGLYDTIKGSLDLQAGIESPEKDAFIATMSAMTPEELKTFQKSLTVVGNYIHGQHVADIAADGNAPAKVMNVRFTWPSDPIPTEPIDEAWAEALVRASQESVDFMKANDVKVVNMSWRVTKPMIESLLQVTGAEPDPEARKARADRIFSIMEDGLTEAFASAPEILFVAGAGNEDENVEFVTSVPAGINLPNLITIGAVDKELQPAGFTSYGASIDLYANGFEVPGRVPGGRELNLSGTSMAAPQVANLAAKLWAVNPDLTVEEVIAAMTETATPEGDEGLLVIHPANAVAAVQ